MRGMTFAELDTYNETKIASSPVSRSEVPLPFYPLDYNHGETHSFKFSMEYLATHGVDVSTDSSPVSDEKQAVSFIQEEDTDHKEKEEMVQEYEEEDGFLGMGDLTVAPTPVVNFEESKTNPTK